MYIRKGVRTPLDVFSVNFNNSYSTSNSKSEIWLGIGSFSSCPYGTWRIGRSEARGLSSSFNNNFFVLLYCKCCVWTSVLQIFVAVVISNVTVRRDFLQRGERGVFQTIVSTKQREIRASDQLAEIRLLQIMKRMSTFEQNISPDSWIKIFSYLLASDAVRLTSCSKYLHERVGENEFVWRELLTWGDAQLLRQVVNQSLSFKQLACKPAQELKSVDETPKASSSSR